MKKAFTPLNLIAPTARKRYLTGFTLIEILIVCTIIALLAAVVIVNLEKAQAKSRDVQRKADISKIAAAVEMYKVDNKSYPIYPADGSATSVDVNSTAMPALVPFLVSFPVDPKNSSDATYRYIYRGTTAQFKLAAKSETITYTPSDCPTWATTSAAVKTDVLNKAGDFYDPSPNDCMWFQISSSTTARDSW